MEDLLGTVEVIVFQNAYDRYKESLNEDNKVFIRGRVSEEDEAASKLICESVIPFDQKKKELWVQFKSIEEFNDRKKAFHELLLDSEGKDDVVIYCTTDRALKRLSKNYCVNIDPVLIGRMKNFAGEENVRVVEKPIEMKH